MIELADANALELDSVLAAVRTRCATQLGQERLERIAPLPDGETAVIEATRIAAWVELLLDGRDLPLDDPGDVTAVLRGASKHGLTLSGDELVRVLRLLVAAAQVETFLSSLALDSSLRALRCADDLLVDLRRLLSRALDEQGAVRDDASPELAAVRARARTISIRLDRQVEQFFAGHRDLSEQIVTVRDDRTVVAIRSDQNPSSYGFTHGRSSTGVTFYVEPFGLLELNNEAVSLRDEEAAEVERILRELTEHVRVAHASLMGLAASVGEVDYLRARARLARRLDSGVVELSNREIDLVEARHPSLVLAQRIGSDTVVPLDLQLQIGESVIVTGPNTGGKTVALKTAALALLSFALGLPVAARRARVPLIRALVVDLGDAQDIAQSLSTFSGHLRVIARALGELAEPALVILDELGAGTDPREGGALGVAVVEELRRRGVTTLVTSHHEALKGYALGTEGVHAAAVEFDEETLQPTFRLQMDRTGASNALIIADRLGIPTTVIRRARELVEGGSSPIEQAMSSIEETARQLDRSRADVEMERVRQRADGESLEARARAVAERESELEERERTLRQRLRREVHSKLDAVVEELREEGEQRLARMAGEGRPGDARALERTVGKLARSALGRVTEVVQDSARLTPIPTLEGPIGVGDRVRLIAFGGVDGVVESVRGNELVVAVAGKRLHATRDAAARLAPAAVAVDERGAVSVEAQVREREAARELNLLGCTVEQAVDLIDQFLNEAVVARLPEVCIIHGHGSGRLRTGVRGFLSEHPMVSAVVSDRSGGATLATLDV